MRESDEDPPDRGLAALMTAAREKASEMAEPPRESWWQKIIATLRRPPVLALASVMVLLGGALFVMQRSDKLSSETKTEETQQVPAPAQTGPIEKARDVAPVPPPGANAAVGSASAAEVPAVIAQPDPAPPDPVVKPPVSRAVKAPRMRPASPPPPPAEPVKTEATDKDKDGELAKQPEPATAGATRGPVRTQESMEPTADSFGAVDLKATTQTKSDEGGGDRSKLVTQLVKQCESAAARGDCAAVRVIAGRIKSEDSSAYSQRVVKNSSIARCLDSAATTVK
jgi:hypothetical protein